MRRLSLISQLAAVLIVITTLVATGFWLQRYLFLKDELHTALDTQLHQTLARLQVSLAIPAYNVDVEIVEGTIRSEMLQREVHGVFVTENGLPSPVYGFVKNGGQQVMATATLPAKGQLISAAANLQVEEEDFAVVEVFVTPCYLQELLSQKLLRLVLEILVLVFLQVVVAALVLKRLFVRPVRQLTALSRKIADGEGGGEVRQAGSMELAQLAASLYRMRDSIRQSMAELADNNERLRVQIQERMEAEENLRASRENIKTILNSLGEGVISTDRHGLVKTLNPVAETLVGLTAEAAMDQPIDQVLQCRQQGRREPKASKIIANLLETGSPFSLLQGIVLVCQDGHECNVTCTGTPIYSNEQEVVGCVLVLTDVSEQLKLAAQLRQSQKMDSIGQLAGGIAHDFNNMLAGIMGAASILQLKARDDEQTEKNVEVIMESAQRAADLTRQLLSFARKGDLVKEQVDLHEVVAAAVAILRRTVDKSISIKTSLTAGEHTVFGDKSQLQSVIINLGVNGRDAMPDGGTLQIATRNSVLDEMFCANSPFAIEPGHYIELSVRDTGTGIGKEISERIFDPFFTTKNVGKGTGLGLAAVYGTVRGHGGLVHVYSEPGEGALFKIYLPVQAREEGLAEEVAVESGMQYGTGTILVVDDEEMLRNILKESLEMLGYEVILAENGQVALERYRENRGGIDLVILDMIMPDLNGKETFAALTALDPAVQVVFSSGFSREENFKEMASLGAGFIQKPYNITELSQLVARLVGQNGRAGEG
ncbi:MAG: response regulator [Thermodesulfobacteriota bacterium]